jgi:hypothetical protein
VARFLLNTTVLIDVRGRSAAERLLEIIETSDFPMT